LQFIGKHANAYNIRILLRSFVRIAANSAEYSRIMNLQHCSVEFKLIPYKWELNGIFFFFYSITYIVMDYNIIIVNVIFYYTVDNSNFFLKNSNLKDTLL